MKGEKKREGERGRGWEEERREETRREEKERRREEKMKGEERKEESDILRVLLGRNENVILSKFPIWRAIGILIDVFNVLPLGHEGSDRS